MLFVHSRVRPLLSRWSWSVVVISCISDSLSSHVRLHLEDVSILDIRCCSVSLPLSIDLISKMCLEGSCDGGGFIVYWLSTILL